MSETLEREIAALPKMNIAQLQAKWRVSFKHAPPLHVRKQLLVPLLAYKLQEQAYGGLKPEIRRYLEKLAASYRQDPDKKAESHCGSSTNQTRNPPSEAMERQNAPGHSH